MKIKDPITTKKASELLGVSLAAFQKMVQRGQVAAEKIGLHNYVSRRAVRRLKKKREARETKSTTQES